MKELIFVGDNIHVYLTTESSLSSYGMPILRFEDFRGNWDDNSPLEYGVEDILANGMTGREMVLMIRSGDGAKSWNKSTREIVDKFLNQFKEN